MIRHAIADDLYPLCALAKRFINETNLPYTYDDELTRNNFWNGIHDNGSIILVDIQEELLAGLVMGYMERDFCKEYSAYITKLYVEKEFRGSSIARDLITAFEAETTEATLLFTSATGGMGERNEKLYVHLFEHAGYAVLGRILVKENL